MTHHNRVGDEGTLDPWVAEWFASNPMLGQPFEDFSPEMLELARSPVGAPPMREVAKVTDDVVDGVPVRCYEHDGEPTGLLVYFHGGGFCIGSIGLMDNVARELAYTTGAAVISVDYRLAPEHPYPAAVEDAEAVTRWAFANAVRFQTTPRRVAVAGESAGGNLSAVVALRLRDDDAVSLAAQVLLYPAVAGGGGSYASREQFEGIVLTATSMQKYDAAYSGGRDLRDDPGFAPLRAERLTGLPPAFVVLAGCDPLRDEGRDYARRLREDDVAVEEICFAGQPHGFVNFGFPAAASAFDRIGTWLRTVFTTRCATHSQTHVTRRIES
jgi:acetyl esterase